MKIDSNRTGLDSVGTVRSDAAEGGTPSTASRPGTVAPDQAQFSSGAQLAGAAAKAAAIAPDIRSGEVERAKALLDSGRLGADAHALADALIDHTISGD
jgi:flagellar biosynthesis anti-sigma factor FlgM